MNREEYLIQRLSSPYIGDDGAIVGDKIYSMDAFFEGVHFKREWMSLEQIARKAMLVNISDAVAMNAQPLYALVTLSMPKQFTREEIDRLLTSLHETAEAFGCEIIGGDTISGERLDLSITIISESDDPLTRKGLEEGNLLAFTGTLGESKRDLDRLFRGESIAESSRFINPVLRQAFITKARPYLSVGMDISDGLYCDTNKLLEYNDTGFVSVIEISEAIGRSGEEYEMLVGFDAKYLDILKQIAQETDTPFTVFARVVRNGDRYP
ncbi:MAG TPA: thiamine-phosphate kinase, partial [Campylobacterales bacterium]|nr:thiamine-phosphate kinase [Campylobacterales bacterium]